MTQYKEIGNIISTNTKNKQRQIQSQISFSNDKLHS